MKKKIFSILFALVLALSLCLVTAVPVGAQSTLEVSKWTEYAENPIFGQGVEGPKAYYPSVIKIDGTYYMYTGGLSGINYATSTDGISWTDQGSTEILGNHPWVIQDDTGYKMYYVIGMYDVWMATSLDGITWGDLQDIVIPAAPDVTVLGAYSWSVIYNGPGDYEAWGDEGQSGWLIYSTSTDGITWTPVTSRWYVNGTPGEYMYSAYTRPHVLKEDGEYYMWFGYSPEESSSGWNEKIGYATGANPTSFTLVETIFTKDDGIAWRNDRTYTPCVIKEDGLYKMWFSGKADSNYAIGYATIPSPLPDYYTIQAAIDAANPTGGDTINVAAGTYNEALWIEKSLTMLSISGATDTIIDGTGVDQERAAPVMISASDVVFGREGEGFTVKGGKSYNLLLTRELGLAEAPTYENILIEGNTLEGSERSFASSGGAYTANLIGVTVSKNTINYHQYGAYLDIGTDWRLIDNTLNGSWFTLTGSSAGIVSGNTFVGAGVSLAQSSNFVINRNSFSGETWDGSYIHVWPPCDPSTFDATLNWWSTTDPLEIKDRILVDVPEVTVDFFPWALDEARTQFTSDATDVIVVNDDWVGSLDYTPVTVDGTDYYIGVNAFATIQYGIDAADPGGTVNVAAGSYGSVVINKSLTLRGAQAGVDARTRSGDESVIDHGSHYVVCIYADNVIFDGFTVTLPLFTGKADASGFVTELPVCESNIRITNCIIHDIGAPTRTVVDFGAFAINMGSVDGLEIDHNLIYNITHNDPTFAWNNAIIIWGVSETLLASNVNIHDNKMYDIEGPASPSTTGKLYDGGIFISTDCENVVIDNNEFTNCGEYGISTNWDASIGRGTGSAVTITNNMISGSTVAGIRCMDKADTITGNTISGCGAGIQVREEATAAPTVHLNNISGNTVGLENNTSFTVDATNNWWGATNGPSGVGLGDGDAVSANVDFADWLAGPFEESTGAVSMIAASEEAFIGISVEPTSIDFGSVTSGAIVSGDQLTVTNLGNVSIIVDAEITADTFFNNNQYFYTAALRLNQCPSDSMRLVEPDPTVLGAWTHLDFLGEDPIYVGWYRSVTTGLECPPEVKAGTTYTGTVVLWAEQE